MSTVWQVRQVLFTAQDAQTICDALGRAKPTANMPERYVVAVARRQADQIYNLSLTRTAATVILGQGARRAIGASGEDANLGYRVQARKKSGTSCHSPILKLHRHREGCGRPIPDAARAAVFELSGARLRKKLPMWLGTSRQCLPCASRISAASVVCCTIALAGRKSCGSRFGWLMASKDARGGAGAL